MLGDVELSCELVRLVCCCCAGAVRGIEWVLVVNLVVVLCRW